MPSIDQTAKAQFAKVFTKADWSVFKCVADTYFERSARLRRSDMSAFPLKLRLLARNIEKRLLIGIGTELLLKAVYLRHGFRDQQGNERCRRCAALPIHGRSRHSSWHRLGPE